MGSYDWLLGVPSGFSGLQCVDVSGWGRCMGECRILHRHVVCSQDVFDKGFWVGKNNHRGWTFGSEIPSYQVSFPWCQINGKLDTESWFVLPSYTLKHCLSRQAHFLNTCLNTWITSLIFLPTSHPSEWLFWLRPSIWTFLNQIKRSLSNYFLFLLLLYLRVRICTDFRDNSFLN